MKNQYFGDKRDYLKYDLLQETVEKMDCVNKLSFIPMLTKNDQKNDGNNRNYEMGKKRPELYRFLRGCSENNQLNILSLRRYFDGWAYEYCPYRDEEWFENYNREAYFEGIPTHYLYSAVVFLDPDNGLEPLKTRSKKHVLTMEVQHLLNRMDKDSLLVIYQHKTHQTLDDMWMQKVKQLLDASANIKRIIMVSDNDVGFLCMGKETDLLEELFRVWSDYASNHGLYFFDSNSKVDPPFPEIFSAAIGGFGGPYYQVIWKDGTLTYSTDLYGTPQKLLIEPEQWRYFWKALIELGVWKWEERYNNPGVLDGTSWSIHIEYQGRSVKSFGSNAYPGGEQRIEPSVVFRRFCRAVSALVGGREFQ